MRVGYARVSTTDQAAGLEAQRRELVAASAERLFEEEVSSVDRDSRAKLATALDFIRDGDVLIVTKLDRLARSVAHLLELVELVERKGASLRDPAGRRVEVAPGCPPATASGSRLGGQGRQRWRKSRGGSLPLAH